MPSRIFYFIYLGNVPYNKATQKNAMNLAARKQHALNGQKQVFATYALKGQQLLAQGSALGNHRRTPLAL